MKKVIFNLLIVFFLSPARAQNTEIFRCRVSNQEWNSIFLLDAVGESFLTFKKTGDNRSYICGLKVVYINDGQRAITPNVTLEFQRGTCEPELGALEQEIFDHFIIIVDMTNKSSPKARVQWLKRMQPDPCKVEKNSMFDISMNAKKWIKGTWGKRKASDPKSFKQVKEKK